MTIACTLYNKGVGKHAISVPSLTQGGGSEVVADSGRVPLNRLIFPKRHVCTVRDILNTPETRVP